MAWEVEARILEIREGWAAGHSGKHMCWMIPGFGNTKSDITLVVGGTLLNGR